MITSTGKGWIGYHEGMFSVSIHDDGVIEMWHCCAYPSDYGEDTGNDIVYFDEMKDNECVLCGELDIPESLQGLYILYKYGKGENLEE